MSSSRSRRSRSRRGSNEAAFDGTGLAEGLRRRQLARRASGTWRGGQRRGSEGRACCLQRDHRGRGGAGGGGGTHGARHAERARAREVERHGCPNRARLRARAAQAWRAGAVRGGGGQGRRRRRYARVFAGGSGRPQLLQALPQLIGQRGVPGVITQGMPQLLQSLARSRWRKVSSRRRRSGGRRRQAQTHRPPTRPSCPAWHVRCRGRSLPPARQRTHQQPGLFTQRRQRSRRNCHAP